ncbi:probable LRR receptor-like serine/threonine-protein kinase At4g36180 isoform X2 [Ananas comosus]|uniref:Probable LRR receptor-like serine/threonine-protein kinase At4g36180 isoform X2 n=1 Tax=Ananas comosus TaxID=4615 RepID=A0A6P5ECB9_ANACO|nr:probable LRR receptor-like serine/threonine-protein kinase At4g36180 isoform X2 [Ananas comosus]
MGLYYHHSINDGFSGRALIIMRITLVIVIISMMMLSSKFGVGCPVEEYEALLELKASCNGTSPPSWGKHRDCCLWERVVCDNNTKQVTELHLYDLFWYYYPEGNEILYEAQSWQLNLSIFSSFRELRYLDLSWNRFTGLLSSTTALVGLKKLKELDLSGNQFTGEIPMSLGYLTSLEVLYLGWNELNASHSLKALVGLKKLKVLDLSGNQFIGEIPMFLGSLISLEVLDLSNNNLNGLLPLKVLQELTNLQVVRLAYNQFSGSLPLTLGNFTFLQYVDFSGNFLEGTIPKQLFKGLVSLQYLDLSNNYLYGEFSLHSFYNISKLEGIILSNNEGLEVDINSWSSVQQLQLRILMLSSCKLEKNAIRTPTFICSQRQLEALDLSNNNLIGNVPTCLLNNNTKMEYLILRSNILTGTIHLPTHHMTICDVSDNLFSGSLPSNINNHISGEVPAQLVNGGSELFILKLSNNNLHGKISGLNFTSGSYINLGGNKLSGTLPSNIDGVMALDVHDNDLSGLIPETPWDTTELEVLILRGNHFEGPIPQWLCNETRLYILDLSDNSLSGSLPRWFHPFIWHLNLANNCLTGEVPSVLFNLSNLEALDISKNYLSGQIPMQIGSELQMLILILRENSFSGLVPCQLCSLQNLHILDLSHNNFSGPIPSCLGTMAFRSNESQSYFLFPQGWVYIIFLQEFQIILFSNFFISYKFDATMELQEEEFTTKGNFYMYQRDHLVSMTLIDMSANKLTGKIPPEIGNLSGLVSLNLSYNQLTGPIPAALSNLSQIESLDISHNKLSGGIPWQLDQLKFLEVFSVAQNNLSGCIPNFRDQLATFGEAAYAGNVGLHGPPLDRMCTSASNTTAPLEEEDKEVSSIDKVIFYAISAAAYVGGFWFTIFVLFCNRWGRNVRVRLDSYVDYLFAEISMVVRKIISM